MQIFKFCTYSLLRTLRRAAHGASGRPRLPWPGRRRAGACFVLMSTRIEIKFTRQNTQVHTFMQYESIMQYIRVVSELCWLKTARETKAQGLRPARRRRGQALSARSALVSAESRQGWLWLAVALPARLDAPGAPNSTPLTPSPPHEATSPPRLPLLRPAPRAPRAAEAARPSRRAVRLRGAAAGW